MSPVRLIFRNEHIATGRYVGVTLVVFSWRLRLGLDRT